MRASLSERWMYFLQEANPHPSNRDRLLQYILDGVANDVSVFGAFLSHFHTHLARLKKNEAKQKLASAYLAVLSPLAERFGFLQQRALLDRYCFKIAYPQDYQKLDHALRAYKQTSRHLINRVLKRLRDLIVPRYPAAVITGRYKNIYSIFKKMREKQKIDVFDLNDIFACRIILSHERSEDCFEIMNLLHDRFTPLPHLFKDYITIPKINGYRSLHTGLKDIIPNLTLSVEVQIRTHSMDQYAEHGGAVHWVYARHKKAVLPTPTVSAINDKSRKIYCLSPKGDIIILESNVTVLDLAYIIHTDLGDRVTGAMVNGMSRRLCYRLKNGDEVTVLGSSQKQVSSQWLKYDINRETHKKILTSLTPST